MPVSERPFVSSPHTTLAIVLGASKWPFYPQSSPAPSFRDSARDMAAYLGSTRGLGLPPENLLVSIDSPDEPSAILRQMRGFIRNRREELKASAEQPVADLIFYYVGHGAFDSGRDFDLTLRSTDVADPNASSIMAKSLGLMIRELGIGIRNYLILDACFSGAIVSEFMGAGPLGVAATQMWDALPSYGTALLCSSSPRDVALAPTGELHTAFTGALLDVLCNGEPDAPEFLSLDDVHRLVQARLNEKYSLNMVRPTLYAADQRSGRVDRVPLFPNVARTADRTAVPQGRSHTATAISTLNEPAPTAEKHEPPPSRIDLVEALGHRRLAYLIGNETFGHDSGLLTLGGPLNDVAALAEVLGNADYGGFEVYEFLDKTHYEILPSLEEGLKSAGDGDLILIFYAGHGKPSLSGDLHLATANTREKALHTTSIPAWSLHSLVKDSGCGQVVLLLDCCYSGSVSHGLRGTINDQLRLLQNAAGFYILTASTGIQAAGETETESSGKVMGRFTAAIVDGIKSGDADHNRDGQISLLEIKQHLEATVHGQTPQFFAHAGSGDPFISFSPATSAPILDLDVIADLESQNWHRRRGVVVYLADMIRDGDRAAREAALTLLKRRLSQERDFKVKEDIERALR
jgi:uncharacterized caspase-like protein